MTEEPRNEDIISHLFWGVKTKKAMNEFRSIVINPHHVRSSSVSRASPRAHSYSADGAATESSRRSELNCENRRSVLTLKPTRFSDTMFISRGARLFKNVVNTLSTRKNARAVVPARQMSGAFFYRDVPAGPKADVIMAEVLGGFMWWWILWHMWHDWHHVVGEFEYPDPSKWTDEELGIPPDDD